MAREVAEPGTAGERRLTMTYEQWLAWAVGDNRKSEWVDGEVIVFMPTTVRHALVAGFLYKLLSLYVELLDLGEVLAETVEMRFAHAAREPDILFVKRENLHRLTDKRLLGPADLVVELVSDESETRDTVEKVAEYQAQGVPEYWLLDPRPNRQRADFYQLIDGLYRAVPPDEDGRYRSAALPGFWLRPDWLWQEPLPDTLTCLLAIAPEAIAAAQRRAATP